MLAANILFFCFCFCFVFFKRKRRKQTTFCVRVLLLKVFFMKVLKQALISSLKAENKCPTSLMYKNKTAIICLERVIIEQKK